MRKLNVCYAALICLGLILGGQSAWANSLHKRTGSRAAAKPSKETHLIVRVGQDKDTAPWRILENNARQIQESRVSDGALRKTSAAAEMEPVEVRESFFADLGVLEHALRDGRVAIVTLHKGEPVGYMQFGGLRGQSRIYRNCIIGIDGIAAIQGLYEAKDGAMWKMTMPLACGNKSGLPVKKEVTVELPPLELLPPPAEPKGALPMTSIVPEPQPVTEEAAMGIENEVLAGVEIANLPSAATVGGNTRYRTGSIKLTREFAGYRRTWVKQMEGSMLRLVAQGGLENIEQISDDPKASDEHLGGRLWINGLAHLVWDDLTVGLGVGGSYSEDGLAMAYVEPQANFDPRYWGLEFNYNFGRAPSKETTDGDVTTLFGAAYVKPLELFHLDDRIPVNWRVGVRYRDFDLERSGFFEYHAAGPRAYTKLYWEFDRKFEVDPTTGWARQKSVKSFYIQADYGLQDVEVFDWIDGKRTLAFKATQPLFDSAAVFSIKW